MTVDVTGFKKTNIPGFYKNTETGVVINTNEDQLKAYMIARQQTQELNSMKDEHTRLKDDMEKIKKALGI